jgi:hypothetical protein
MFIMYENRTIIHLRGWSEDMLINDGRMKTTHHINQSGDGSSISNIGSRRLACVCFDTETVV